MKVTTVQLLRTLKNACRVHEGKEDWRHPAKVQAYGSYGAERVDAATSQRLPGDIAFVLLIWHPSGWSKQPIWLSKHENNTTTYSTLWLRDENSRRVKIKDAISRLQVSGEYI